MKKYYYILFNTKDEADNAQDLIYRRYKKYHGLDIKKAYNTLQIKNTLIKFKTGNKKLIGNIEKAQVITIDDSINIINSYLWGTVKRSDSLELKFV